MTARARKYRILVVDDEPSVLLTYQMILEQKGYEVVAAPSSAEARRALESSQQLDLLLCDLSLEEKDSGFAIIEYARRRQPGLPTLLLTGYAGKDISARALHLDISVLLKPIDIQEFLGVIRAHLRHAYGPKEASGQ
ncbi:MAG TPA: response regulator [Terriglobales bacterium]|nr:response regulator [Terriglobales bacterium]